MTSLGCLAWPKRLAHHSRSFVDQGRMGGIHHRLVDAIAAKGEAAGCLALPPMMMPAPIGYITMLNDPDGTMIELSWDQGVYATLAEKWGK